MNSPFTIIAATNFSENSVNAVTYAARLAKISGAKLLIFHSFSLPLHSANSLITASGLQAQLDKVTARLTLMASEIAQMYGIAVSHNCSYSFVENHLSILLTETNTKLVVMGMAQRSQEQDLTGNTTTFVIKNFNVPVLAIPPGVHFQDISRVLFAFDTKRKIAAGKLLWLREAVKILKAEVEFFSVDERLNELKSEDPSVIAKNMLEEELQDVKYLYKSVRSNTVIAEIEKEINSFGADVLIMMPQKYGFWDTLVHRSKTRVLASGLNIPLLSLPNY